MNERPSIKIKPGTGRLPRLKLTGGKSAGGARVPGLRVLAPIVPPGNVTGQALILVIAIMSFLACLAVGAVSLVNKSAETWQSQIAREATIQIRPADDFDMDAALQKAEAIAEQFPGVRGARIIGREETVALLEPWLGSGLGLDELPVPRLVVVTIDEANPPDFARLSATIFEQVPHASLDDHRAWVDRLVGMARTTTAIGVTILALVLCALVLTVIFATRGAMAGNQHIIEVLHFVGAETGFIARQFQKRFLLIGLKGAGIGGAAASFVFLTPAAWQAMTRATPLNDQATALFGRFLLPWSGYLWIAIVIAVIAAMTTLTSRMTVIRSVREIDRLRADPSLLDFN